MEIEGRIIKGDLDLSELDLEKVYVKRKEIEINMMVSEYAKCVKSSIKIENCIIRDAVNFSDAIFQNVLRFDGTTFHEDINFKGTKFRKETSFWRVRFDGYVNFDYTEFGQHNIIFDDVRFARIARFSPSHFKGHANFSRTTFNEDAIFVGTRFYAGATFANTLFDGYAHFGSVEFKENVGFSNAGFNKYIDFTAARFGKNLDLNRAKINIMILLSNFGMDSKILLDNSDFTRIDVRWSWIKNHIHYNGAAYLSLIKNFKALEQFEDADDCYYQYRELVRNNPLSSGQSFWSKIYDNISWFSCGYGVRPDYTIWIMVIIIYLSGIVFLGIDKSLLECYYISIMTFVGFSSNNIQLVGYFKLIELILAVSGYLFLALFVVVLARRMIR